MNSRVEEPLIFRVFLGNQKGVENAERDLLRRKERKKMRSDGLTIFCNGVREREREREREFLK